MDHVASHNRAGSAGALSGSVLAAPDENSTLPLSVMRRLRPRKDLGVARSGAQNRCCHAVCVIEATQPLAKHAQNTGPLSLPSEEWLPVVSVGY